MKILKFIFCVLVFIALIIAAYRYFKLDQNKAFQNALKAKNAAVAEAVAKNVVENQIKIQATQYVYDNNSYFVSKSNNICVSLAKNLSVLSTLGNPLECAAQSHTFTARIKTLSSSSYYCLDTSGFYTTTVDEAGYRAGVACKQ